MTREHSRGFTLLEVLVVMALIALLVGTVAPALSRWNESAVERGWRADLDSLLRAQPMRAFRSGAPTAVTDKALRSAMREAPEDLVIELEQPLRYSAAGLAEGGELRVARRGRVPERWQVQPVTGDVQRPGADRP